MPYKPGHKNKYSRGLEFAARFGFGFFGLGLGLVPSSGSLQCVSEQQKNGEK